MTDALPKFRRVWLTIEGGPMDGVVFSATVSGVLPAKLYGPDISPRMAGVYERVGLGLKSATYRLRDDAQQQSLETAWTDYLTRRLTQEESDNEKS